jgi:hypothetical protein
MLTWRAQQAGSLPCFKNTQQYSLPALLRWPQVAMVAVATVGEVSCRKDGKLLERWQAATQQC